MARARGCWRCSGLEEERAELRTSTLTVLFVLGLSGFLLANAPIALAQSSEVDETTPLDPIVTDRPTDSASPVLVPPHLFQLEAGYKFSRIEGDSDTLDEQLLPDLLARYGINKKLEARLVAQGWTSQSGVENQSDTESRSNGFNDISLGTKIALAEERGSRPQMALLIDVRLPVGSQDLTSEYVIPKVLFLGANSLSERLGLTYNIGPSFVTAKSNGRSETNVDLNYAVALSGSLGGPASLFGEFYGAFAQGSDRLDRHSFQIGSTILANRRFQIDVRGGVGLVDNEPEWLIGMGAAFRVPH